MSNFNNTTIVISPRVSIIFQFSFMDHLSFCHMNYVLVIASNAGISRFLIKPVEKKEKNRLVPIELMARHYWFIIRILLLICHNIFICSRSNVNDDLWSENGWNEECLYPFYVTTATDGKDGNQRYGSINLFRFVNLSILCFTYSASSTISSKTKEDTLT